MNSPNLGVIALIASAHNKSRNKVSKVTHAFICNGEATVQGEGQLYCTEWSYSPAIQIPALCENLLYLHLKESRVLVIKANKNL